tara:strand:+ start:399 stop:659 length:261 start_codon:yes stop_codon:yes gene_type:complete
MTEQESNVWLMTPHAGEFLGVNHQTLKRRRDACGGYLEYGKHWRFKTESVNSPILWRVFFIQEEFEKRANQRLRELIERENAKKAQ